MSLSVRAEREIFQLQTRCEQILNKSTLTRSDRSRVDALLAEISTIKKAGRSKDEIREDLALAQSAEFRAAELRREEAHAEMFRMFLRGRSDSEIEQRASDIFQAGTQSVVWSSGPAGGILVPTEFAKSVVLGMAQYDPLLDEDVVSLVQTNGFFLKPYIQPAWDLSQIASSKVAEATQHNADAAIATDLKLLNRWTHRLSLGASFEFEEDQQAYDNVLSSIQQAYSIGFARGIGEDLVLGDGSTAPQGILNGAADSGVSLSSAITSDVSAVLNDAFQNAYFSLNRVYRAQPKCAWFMADKTYQWIRSLTDKQARPLIEIQKDKETLMGKPIYICPSMPAHTPSVADGYIVFGDASHLVVRLSSIWIRRNLQAQGYVEYGKALYTGLQQVDAKVVDPTAGVVPPLVKMTITA